MAQPPQPNVAPGTETPGLTKSWGTKSLSGLGWLSKLSPWSNEPVPTQQQLPPSHAYGMAPPNAAGAPTLWEGNPGPANNMFQPPPMDFAMEQQMADPNRVGGTKRKAAVSFDNATFALPQGARAGAGDGSAIVAHKRPRLEVELYKYDENKKPPYAYTYLIYHAIKDLDKQRVTLGEIYIKIMEDYAYYRARAKNTAWRNSIRHNLTMHKSFIKVARVTGDSGKGGYWRVDEAIAREEIAFEPKPVAQAGSKKKKKKKKKIKKEGEYEGDVDGGGGAGAGGHTLMPIDMTFAAPAGVGHGIPSTSSSHGAPSPQFTYPGQDLGSSPLYAASAELDDVFEDIEQEFGQQSSNPASPLPLSPGIPGIITEELDESALLRKMASQLGNDQPQNRLGASAAGGLPVDLLGVSSAFQASVSGVFSGLSASFNGLQDKFSESFGGVSESFNQIFTWG